MSIPEVTCKICGKTMPRTAFYIHEIKRHKKKITNKKKKQYKVSESDRNGKCCRCGLVKDYSEFYNNCKASDGLSSYCKSCTKLYQEENKERLIMKRKEYYNKNKEARREKTKKWLKNNKERNAKRQKEYYEKNKEWLLKKYKTKEYKEINRIRQCAERKNLCDSYIKRILIHPNKGIKHSDVPQELVELKRAQIMLHRAIQTHK